MQGRGWEMKSRPKRKPAKRIDRAKRLFQKAVDANPSEQRRLITQASRAGSSTKNLVRGLLKAHGTGNVLDSKGSSQGSSHFETLTRLGPYLLVERLDSGGMAEVYLGVKAGVKGFEKEVALKCILPKHSMNPRVQSWFEDEAKLGSSLNHPNIVQTYDFVHLDNSFWLVMEFIRGKHLGKMLDQMQNPWESQALPVYIGCEILKGLEYAHERVDEKTGEPAPVIHRDIAPKNIVVSYSGEVKIVDFGIAKEEVASVRTETQIGVVKGTPAYMSPEQSAGKVIDHRTDIFSAGVVLYELLAQRPLFSRDSRSPKVDLQSFIRRRIATLDVGKPLRHVLARALETDPAKRYQTAAAFRKDLEAHFASDPLFNQKSLASFLGTLWSDAIEEERRASQGRQAKVQRLLRETYHLGTFSGANAEPSWKRSRLILALLIFTVLTSATNILLQLVPEDMRINSLPSLSRGPASAEFCQVILESDPSRTLVVANALVIGATPTTFRVKCGVPFTLELKHDGFKTLEMKATTREATRHYFLKLDR